MEGRFPGKKHQYDGTITLDKTNTFKKFALDQTIGALVNTAIFIGTFAAFRGKPVQRAVRRDTFPLMINGWKLWPAVSLLNFTVVPVHRRILVGSTVGLFWGIFLSFVAAGD